MGAAAPAKVAVNKWICRNNFIFVSPTKTCSTLKPPKNLTNLSYSMNQLFFFSAKQRH